MSHLQTPPNTTGDTISRIISFIPEALINDIYLKIINQFKTFGLKTKFNFYLTILYDGKIIRSRVLNSKGDTGMNSDSHDLHTKFFETAKTNIKIDKFAISKFTESKDDISTTVLQIGNISIIVSNEEERAVEICSSIIGILLLQYKSFSLKKEGVQFIQLKNFFIKNEDGSMLWYLSKIGEIQNGSGSF